MLSYEFNYFNGRCRRHVRPVQKLAFKWTTNPGWRQLSTSGEVGLGLGLGLAREPGPRGVVYKSQRNKLSVSFSHSGDLLSTSHHWPSQQPPIHFFPCYANAMLWVPIAKISICLSILSIAFPAILPWTFPGLISIEEIGFPYNKTSKLSYFRNPWAHSDPT